MIPVWGPGVSLDNERSRVFHAPLTDLPVSERLILPICPEGEENRWQIVPEQTALSRFASVAESAETVQTVKTPYAGTLERLEPLPLPGKGVRLCAWIKTNPQAPYRRRVLNHAEQVSPEEILRAAESFRLVDETDGQLLAHKLRNFCARGITELICDGVCDDPYNTDDLCALMEYTEDICDGLSLAAAVCGTEQPKIVVSRAWEAGIAAYRRLIRQSEVPILNAVGKYPIWPKLIRQKPFSGQQTGRIGAQVCKRLSRAVRLNQPPHRVVVTVSGSAVREPQNFSVLIGTPLAVVLNQCAMGSDGYRQVAVQSAINGYSVVEPDRVPVMQDTRCILAFREFPTRSTFCVECGRCAEVCPAGVFPVAVIRSVQRGDRAAAQLYGINNCIGCGACEAVCPANLRIRALLHGSASPRIADSWRSRSE